MPTVELVRDAAWLGGATERYSSTRVVGIKFDQIDQFPGEVGLPILVQPK
jgi:hypothetical protein